MSGLRSRLTRLERRRDRTGGDGCICANQNPQITDRMYNPDDPLPPDQRCKRCGGWRMHIVLRADPLPQTDRA